MVNRPPDTVKPIMKNDKCYLYIESALGLDRGKIWPLDKEITILGRSKQCDISLTDETISRQHIELVKNSTDPVSLVLKDLNSRNGVYVNGKKVTEQTISIADRIAIGDTILVIRHTATPLQLHSLTPEDCFAEQQEDTGDSLEASIGVAEVNLSRLSLSTVEAIIAQKRLQTLYKISEIITLTATLPEKLHLLLEAVFESIPAETGFIALKNETNGELEPLVSRPMKSNTKSPRIKASWTIINKCIEQKSGILASDATKDKRFDISDSIVREQIRSVLAVPLFFQVRLMGVIFLSSGVAHARFSESDLEFLTGIANEIALVIERDQNLKTFIAREKMAEVGDFVAGISHYIKNILFAFKESQNIIDSAIQMADYQSLELTWPIVKNSAERIADLVQDMLYFSKERKGLKQPHDIHKIIREIMLLYRPVMTKNKIECEMVLDKDLPPCSVDDQAINRLVLNLIKNAVDALKDHPAPKISIQTRLCPGGNELEIVVKDNGCGIPPQNLDKIFHYLFSTKGSQGTGIGLFVSKKIAEDHGGTLCVESEINRGTSFITRLPLGN